MYGTRAVCSCLESKAKPYLEAVCAWWEVVKGGLVAILWGNPHIIVSWTGGIFHKRLFSIFSWGEDNPSFQCPWSEEEGED